MSKSTHRVEVVPITLEPHPNPEINSLSIVRVWGYQVVVKTELWEGVDRGAYIVPDSVVPDAPAFDFLGDNKRIRVRKFGGALSQGMMTPAPEGSEIGDDVAEILGITRYVTEEDRLAENDEYSIPFSVPFTVSVLPKYDVESWHRFNGEFVPGELVVVTEKLHGSNARFTFDDDENCMFVGSKENWRRPDLSNIHWECLDNNPWIREFCESHPHLMMVGELLGNQKGFKYGVKSRHKPGFRYFDMWHKEEHRFLTHAETSVLPILSENMVPLLYFGPYDEEVVKSHADGQTAVAGDSHIREGCIVSREDNSLNLKIVSDKYYLK